MNESKENTEREIQRDREYEERWGIDPEEIRKEQRAVSAGSGVIDHIFKNAMCIKSGLGPWVYHNDNQFLTKKHLLKMDVLIAFVLSALSVSYKFDFSGHTMTEAEDKIQVTIFSFDDHIISVGSKIEAKEVVEAIKHTKGGGASGEGSNTRG